MAIRTLKNTKGKVIGLSINGKSHNLSKDICHALSLEEIRAQKEAQSAIDKIKIANKELSQKSYHGMSNGLKIDIIFTDKNEVNELLSKVEFIGKYARLDDINRRSHVELLDHFIMCLNQASGSHNHDIELSLKGIIKKSA